MSNIMDAAQPGLYGQNPEKSTNISDKFLDSLSLAVQTLRAEKKITLQKLRITVENLVKLWDLMEASEKEEKTQFTKVASVFSSLEEDIVSRLFSLETLKNEQVVAKRDGTPPI
ncbi:65-kDa microtubule-associated protein 7-like [Carex rostrata]